MSGLKEDINAAERKKDHIDLAFKSTVEKKELDTRFYYEPILSAHPTKENESFSFIGKNFRAPIWISSMTGGTSLANHINKQLAKVCNDFGLGMGLGSCRSLLFDDTYLEDFAVRKYIGDQPLYANLGIAQIEELSAQGKFEAISELLKKLEADGLIIHVNPMQEWLQPEGDIIKRLPLDTIKEVIEKLDTSIIVKEVGQGMGYESIKALIELPIDAIEFAAHGGTNFAMLEMMRANPEVLETYEGLAKIGHSAEDMVLMLNKAKEELGAKMKCKDMIISGGVKGFLDGYYLNNLCNSNSIYGQASSFLKHALGDYENLYTFTENQIKGYRLAESFLRIRK